MNDLGDRIGLLVFEEYEKLKSSFKPGIKSNGIREWTVLASVVAIDRTKSTNNLKIITLSTGLKATPEEELKRSNGKILHDCHAEILSIRGFNSLILHEIRNIEFDNEESELLLRAPNDVKSVDIREKHNYKYRLNPKWKLALYISRLPCGDSSMDTIDSLTEEDKLINMTDDDPYQYIDPENRYTLRGRFNYKKKGFVRTKPGRMDSKITLSKSCSDKLAIRQVTSLLNCMTWSLLEQPIYLDYLVLPSFDVRDRKALERCFKDRLIDSPYPVHFLEILSCSLTFKDDQSNNEEDKEHHNNNLLRREPSLSSFIKLYSSSGIRFGNKASTFEQVILNGVKNGFYTKAKKPLRKNCESIVSKYSQWQLYKKLRDCKGITYQDFKHNQNIDKNGNGNVTVHDPERILMINITRKYLTNGNLWIQTYPDEDFGSA